MRINTEEGRAPYTFHNDLQEWTAVLEKFASDIRASGWDRQIFRGFAGPPVFNLPGVKSPWDAAPVYPGGNDGCRDHSIPQAMKKSAIIGIPGNKPASFAALMAAPFQLPLDS